MIKKAQNAYNANKTIVVNCVKKFDDSCSSIKKSRSFRASDIDIERDIDFVKRPLASEKCISNTSDLDNKV